MPGMTKNFGGRLRRLRELRGMGVNELGRAAGLTGSQISAMENSRRKAPAIDTVEKLAGALSVTVEQLRGSAALQEPEPSALLNQLAAVIPEEIPPLEGVARAGTAGVPADIPPDALILAVRRMASGNRRRLIVQGDCMEPDIPDGAEVVINTQREPQDGEPIIVRIADRVLCKTLVARNGEWRLGCVNERYSELALRPGEDMEYLGVVEKVIWSPPRRRMTS